MSQLAPRATLAPRIQVRRLDVDAQALTVAGGLLVAAAWLAHRWWTGPTAVPLSWALPSARALFLLPTVVVLGLLALRLTVGGRGRTETSGRLTGLVIRWAGVAAVTTVGWLAVTLVDLYGGLGHLTAADNLLAVISSDDGAVSQIVLIQLMALVSMFGTRVQGRIESTGLLVLTGVAILAAFPFAPAGHGHGASDISSLVPLLAAYQVLALAAWVGVLLAGLHLRGPAPRLRGQLAATGTLLTATAVVAGVAAVLAGQLYPGLPTPPVIAAVGLAAVGVLATVGRSQRLRVLDLACTRGGLARAGLVGGEVVVLVAVVMLACWLPIGG